VLARGSGFVVEHLGANDAVEPEVPSFAVSEIVGVEACLVPLHEHAVQAEVARGLEVVAIDVDDAQTSARTTRARRPRARRARSAGRAHRGTGALRGA
jgi:hypothetical protein